MKKSVKVFALILVACMAFLFAGCDVFGRNNASYYNQTVITVSYEDGNKIEISRREFITVYNNYISNYNYEPDNAKESAVDALVNRKILLTEAKRVAKTSEGASVELTTADKNELYYQTYTALLSNVQSYEEEVNDAWDIPEVDTMAEDISSETTVYTPYSKKARPVYDKEAGEYKIQLLDQEKEPHRDITVASLSEVYNLFVAETKNSTNDVVKEEYRRYLASLIATQKLFGTNYSEEELLKEEIKRIYTSLEENEYITKYEDYTQDTHGYSSITIKQVLDKYRSMVYSSKFKYDNDQTSYDNNMVDSFKDVNYFINDDYFYVAHILVQFSDEQKAKLEELETLSNGGKGYIISAEQYESDKAKLYSDLMASERNLETGEVENEDVLSASDLLTLVQNKVNAAKTKEAKDEAFRELMYKYNEDGGIMNADYSYVIGINNSKMVEPFTDAARELNNAGVYGGVSGLVESEYGVHIIYYMGKCTNPFTVASDGTLDLRENYTVTNKYNVETHYSDAVKLDEVYLNNLNNKTLFDLIYEQLDSDNYSEFENRNLDALVEQWGIEVTVSKNLV